MKVASDRAYIERLRHYRHNVDIREGPNPKRSLTCAIRWRILSPLGEGLGNSLRAQQHAVTTSRQSDIVPKTAPRGAQSAFWRASLARLDYINEPKLSEQIQGILFFEHCKISARNRPKMQKQTHRGDLSPSRNAQDDRSLTLPVDFDQTKPNDRAFPDIRV